MLETELYKHDWKPNQLLVYNNYKTVHKRDATPDSVVRQHAICFNKSRIKHYC